jgi:DNA-binding MarR family transcriptional regulator
LIKRARRQMTNAIRARLEPIGTSLPVVQVMRRLVDEGQVNQLELARRIELEPAAVCRLLVGLESKGLVVRRRDADDNRRVLVAATPSGRALLAKARPHVLAGIEDLVSRLERSEQVELSRLLSKMTPKMGMDPEDDEPSKPQPRP